MFHTADRTHSAKSDINRLARTIGIVALFAFAVLSCDNMFPLIEMEEVPSGGPGALEISFGGEFSSSLMLPDIDMQVHDYQIVGAGPDGAEFTETVSSSTTISQLVPGSWTVTVFARNAAQTVIGRGESATQVRSGQTSPLTVVVTPLEGDGTFDLLVTWPQADVTAPTVTGSIIPDWGDPIDLTFALDLANGTADATALSLPGGYYRVSVQIRSGSHVVAGAVDVARIVEDGLTDGTITFEAVNSPDGGTTVTIDPGMDDPLTVQLGGALDQIEYGRTMALSASIAETDVDATYEWYLDGALVGTDATYTVPGDLAIGPYRLDVVAIGTGVDRYGSLSHDFTVTSLFDPVVVQATSFTLSWDVPVSPAEIASYNVYYRPHGTTDWALLGGVAASPSPEYTVTNADLAYGVYDFAVTSVSTEGLESEIHTSLDDTAQPDGWFLDWRAP